MKLPTVKLKKHLVLHPVARSYFFRSICLIALVLFALDAFFVPYLEDSGKLVGLEWREENVKINNLMAARNHADKSDPIWRSDSMPVSVDRKKPKRILVMGDSFVWGHGYTNVNTIWWRQLQCELERRGYGDVEVIAAGLRGLATWQQVDIAKRLVPIYKPDALIWGYVTNDPDEIGHLPNSKAHVAAINLPRDPAVGRRTENVIRALLPNLGEQLLALREHNREKRLAGERNGYRFGDWELEILKGDSFAQYGETVSELANFVHSEHIPSFVITFPNCVMYDCAKTEADLRSKRPFLETVRNYYEARYAPVKEVFDKNGVEFADLTDAFITYAKQNGPTSVEDRYAYGINPGNTHPGPLATHFYAVKAADILERNFPQCLGPRSTAIASYPVSRFNDWVPPWIGLHQSGAETSFTYPADDDLLTMPIRKPYVQLNLERPVALRRVHLQGPQLKEAQLYLSWENPRTHFEASRLQPLPAKKGASATWTLAPSEWADNVSSIKVSAKFKGEDRQLKLTMDRAVESSLAAGPGAVAH